MKHSLRLLLLVSCAALFAAATPMAHAQYSISGTVWEGGTTGDVPAAGAAIYGEEGTAYFTLTNSTSSTDLINFRSDDDNGLSSFLTTAPGGGLNGDTLTYLAGGVLGASAASDNINNDLFQFTGTTTLADGTYTFSHDDGLILYLDGAVVVDNAGPTSADTTDLIVCSAGSLNCVANSDCASGSCTFVSNGGNYGFTLDYAEVDGAPAQLATDLPLTGPAPNVTPEPSSLTLMGTGMLALAGMARRRFLA